MMALPEGNRGAAFALCIARSQHPCGFWPGNLVEFIKIVIDDYR